MTFNGSPYLGVVNCAGQGSRGGRREGEEIHIDELATEDSWIGPANLDLGCAYFGQEGRLCVPTRQVEGEWYRQCWGEQGEERESGEHGDGGYLSWRSLRKLAAQLL
jgi:hypothetical protein